jgi:hypothetical protein
MNRGHWPSLAALGSLAALVAGCRSTPAATGETLLRVDREFSGLAATAGPAAAFARFTDARSLQIRPSGTNGVGTSAFVLDLEGLPPGSLTWVPMRGTVSRSGDLGWTWGDFVFRTGAGVRHGRYVTVWRKTTEGWKIDADIGSNASPAEPR